MEEVANGSFFLSLSPFVSALRSIQLLMTMDRQTNEHYGI